MELTKMPTKELLEELLRRCNITEDNPVGDVSKFRAFSIPFYGEYEVLSHDSDPLVPERFRQTGIEISGFGPAIVLVFSK